MVSCYPIQIMQVLINLINRTMEVIAGKDGDSRTDRPLGFEAFIAYICCFFLVLIPRTEASEKLVVGGFSSGELGGWESEVFEGETEYEIVREDGKSVLQAISQDSASGLVKRQRIDLQAYPYLSWEWKVDKRLPPRREATKEGDDYPARIYLIVSGGWQFWKTGAVNYVWAHNAEKGSSWPNAFAGDNVTMLAIRNREDPTGVWHREKRNVLEDLRRIIGPDVRYVDAIALMTDTDNTDSSALSYYGDIVFTSE